MDTIRQFRVILKRGIHASQQRLQTGQRAAVGTGENEKEADYALLEEYDGSAADPRVDEVGKPLRKGDKPRVRVPMTRRHRLIAWVCFIVYMISIYMMVFLGLSALADQTSIIKERIKGTLANTYDNLAETYEDMKNPGSADEIADLMTEFYVLLADMGYYEPGKIDRAPHINPGINITYAKEIGFSNKAVEMLEKLPYLNNKFDFMWSHGAGDAEFLLSGTFIDFRVDENLESNEDPLYALSWQNDNRKGFDEDGGRYMRPDYICLSVLGNHGTTMILNVKNFKLWTIDQEMGSSDPNLKDVKAKGDEKNDNSLDNYASRAANTALKDYMQRFRNLEWMPGGLNNGSWDGDNYARLYRENGWPSAFNRSAFMNSRERYEESESLRWDAERPFGEVTKFQDWLDSSLRRIEHDQNVIADIDAGKVIPNNQPDRPDRFADKSKYRQELVDEVNTTTASLPKLQQDLEAAREALQAVDPVVKKTREDRIAKYGW